VRLGDENSTRVPKDADCERTDVRRRHSPIVTRRPNV
jgi:hypothetical protein